VLAIVISYHKSGYLGVGKQIVLVIPLVFLVMLLSLGFGLVISAITTKYRDFKFLIDFSIPLLRYVTPGIATTMAIFENQIPREMSAIVKYNPFGYVIDAFNAVLVGAGEIDVHALIYVSAFAIVLNVIGVLAFNQTEKNFMDTV
jgi:lipopolysaccharide transport system permease protein